MITSTTLPLTPIDPRFGLIFVMPSPADRQWLTAKYPMGWPAVDPVWDQITQRWIDSDEGNDFAVHGTSIVGFCNVCQLVLCGGTPKENSAHVSVVKNRPYTFFCSKVCKWIFDLEPDRYEAHARVVQRVLTGAAPGNVLCADPQYIWAVHCKLGQGCIQRQVSLA